MKTALVIGSEGLVGAHLVETLLEDGWFVNGIARKIKSFRTHPRYQHLPCDILKPSQFDSIADNLKTITHIFYAARAGHSDADVEIRLNLEMLNNVLDQVLLVSNSLVHISLVHGTKWYGSHMGPFITPANEDHDRHCGENWYFNQLDLLCSKQAGCNWTWSTVRPHIVCGVSVGYPYNCLTTLAVYATLCRELDKPFVFPGSQGAFDAITQATDASLLAHAQVWAATDPICQNQNFNIINGDYFRWSQIWPVIAEWFGIQSLGPNGSSLASMMIGAEKKWERISLTHGLIEPRLSALASWSFGDFLFNTHWDVMSSTLKLRKYGFSRTVGTEESFLSSFERMRSMRLIP
jgi:nucleoside-diphosphate-sugar epimerase